MVTGPSVVILSRPQVKTHLQAQAASEIAVGHQYKHQVRCSQSHWSLCHSLPMAPSFLSAPNNSNPAKALLSQSIQPPSAPEVHPVPLSNTFPFL